MPIRTSCPTRRSHTADGQLAVAAGSERQWGRLCAALELDGAGRRCAFRLERRTCCPPGRAPADPGRALRCSADKRLARTARGGRGPLRPDPGRPRGARVGAGPGSFDDRRGRAPAPRERSARSASRSSWRATPATVRTAPPLLGEHSAEILAELGWSADAIERAPPRRRDLKPMQACRRASSEPSGSG